MADDDEALARAREGDVDALLVGDEAEAALRGGGGEGGVSRGLVRGGEGGRWGEEKEGERRRRGVGGSAPTVTSARTHERMMRSASRPCIASTDTTLTALSFSFCILFSRRSRCAL